MRVPKSKKPVINLPYFLTLIFRFLNSETFCGTNMENEQKSPTVWSFVCFLFFVSFKFFYIYIYISRVHEFKNNFRDLRSKNDIYLILYVQSVFTRNQTKPISSIYVWVAFSLSLSPCLCLVCLSSCLSR